MLIKISLRLHLLAAAVLLLAAGACAGAGGVLINPGFEEGGAIGGIAGWTVYSRLDPNGYGEPDYKANFDEVVPVRSAGGFAGSDWCAGFPAEGVWTGEFFAHSKPNGREGIRGQDLGKAALSQTVTLEPGCYVFGAWMRTVDGAAYTASFSLGVNFGDPAPYANDSSTGITWTDNDLGLRTSFDGTGFLKERGEWCRYQTQPFTVKQRGRVTVWIRFNYVNENSFPTRWQVDNAFVEPFEMPSEAQPPRIEPTSGEPLSFPPKGQVTADCGDDEETYLAQDRGSTVLDEVPTRMFQHSRAAKGNAWFAYALPVDPKMDVVYLAFEHTGPCKVTIGGKVVRTDTDVEDGKLYPKEYVLTDRSLWRDGILDVRFESAQAGRETAVAWIDCGSTTRYRERLKFVEWDTVSVPWRIGLWDASPNEFRGTAETCVVGTTNYTQLNDSEWRIEWTQKVKPFHRYYLVVNHFKHGDDDQGELCFINMGDDDSVELIGRTLGLSALDLDVTEYLKNGRNVARVKGGRIDWAALIETRPGITDNRKLGIYFGGDALAENITRVMHDSMFWMMSLHYDDSGFVDASVPYGNWWRQYWPIDIAMALRSMLYWGYLDQAERVASLCAKVAWEGHRSNRSGSSDNNGGNMIAADMCEIIARRGFRQSTVEKLWPKVSKYCDQVCDDIESSPFGLLKGTNWENAGNRQEGPCYSLSVNMLGRYMLLKAADTAEAGGLGGDTLRWRKTADRIRTEVLNRLVFEEDVQSPTGWIYPKGTWAYGLKDDGTYMLQPLAGYLWGGSMGAGYFGFIDPDREIRRLYDLTVTTAVPILDTGHRGLISGYAISYDGAQVITANAALSDRPEQMSTAIRHITGSFDYEHDIGSRKAELSRWALGSGGGIEDTNLVGTGEFLDWPRYVTGVDDLLYDGAQLRLIPRLPSAWNECGVNDWSVQYLDGGKRAQTRLSMNYKLARSRAALRVRTDDPVSGMKARIGPFAQTAALSSAAVDGRQVSAEPETSGDLLWFWVEFDSDSTWHEVVVEVE